MRAMTPGTAGSAPGAPPRRLRVFVLDDSAAVLAVLKMRLGFLGHEVVATDSWALLSKEIFSKRPDVIVLDLNMAALPGEQIGPILKKYAPESRLFVFSAEASERLAKARDSTRADGAFAKNQLDALIAAVQRTAGEPGRASGA